MFTPDHPHLSDTSLITRGTIRLNSTDYRCMRLRARGRAHLFLNAYEQLKDVILKHGLEIFGVDHVREVVYVEEIEGVSLDEYIVKHINPWTPDGWLSLKRVVDNALEFVESVKSDEYCAPASLFGFVVKPDLTVQQIDWEELFCISLRCGSLQKPFPDEQRFRDTLGYALFDNIRFRVHPDSDAEAEKKDVLDFVDRLLGVVVEDYDYL